MNGKEVLEKLSIPTKDIAERLGIGLRTCQNYINGSQKIPTPIGKLINYEFVVFDNGNLSGNDFNNSYHSLKLENERLTDRIGELEKLNSLQARNIELLEEQIQLYKDRVKLNNGKSTA